MPRVTRRTTIRAAPALPVALSVRRGGKALANPAVQPASPDRAAEALADRPLFGATTWTLSNGLRVVHVESRRVPVVAHYLFYGAGGGEDPPGRSGVAHFLEHMMFKGSRNVAPGALSLGRGAGRRAGQRLHLARRHRLLPARRGEPPAAGDADGVRPLRRRR